MDEQELSRAIDLLNQEVSPGVGDPELLVLARRVRGLREPTWPDDQAAFAQGLMPPPGALRAQPRAWRGLGGASAAAAVLIAAAVGSSSLLHAPTVLPIPGFAFIGNGVRSSQAIGATKSVHSSPVQMTVAGAQAPAHASLNAPVKGAMQTQVKAATAAPVAYSPMVPALHLEGVALVQGPPRRVEIRVHLQSATRLDATGASLSNLFSHRSAAQVTLQTSHVGSGREWIVGLPVPSKPGWYLLDFGSAPREIAFFMPYPAGTTITGSARTAVHRSQSGPVSIDAVHYGSTYTAIWLHFASVPATWALRLHVPGASAEAPLRTAVLPGKDGVKATFNPILQGSGKVYLQVILGAHAIWLQLPTP